MLVIERKRHQRIVLGDSIIITQLKDGRIGIDAPPGVEVMREELLSRGSVDMILSHIGDQRAATATKETTP